MAHTVANRSAASRVFLVILASAVALGAVVAAFLVSETRRAIRDEAEHVTTAVAASFAGSPAVIASLGALRPARSTQELAEWTRDIVSVAEIDFVTVMTTAGVRLTHPNPDQVGRSYIGTIPEEPSTITEEFTGTLGRSVRTIVPVLGPEEELLGWVAAGVTTESSTATLVRRLPLTLSITAVLVALGVCGAAVGRRVTQKITGDFPPGQVRDAVSSYESLRTLGEALRAQTHEHGNRMHAAVALLELGRRDEAIGILTEASRQSQSLVDQVTARRHGDPTVGALLLGKASQARERGINWRVEIAPDTPRTPLSPVDAVAVLGNLIDNAMDAAGDSPDRWVRVSLRRSEIDNAGIVLEVSDSGPGIPEAVVGRIFDQGFSTKKADIQGRGIGLALVRSVVVAAGGSITLSAEPTMFQVVLPRAKGRLMPP